MRPEQNQPNPGGPQFDPDVIECDCCGHEYRADRPDCPACGASDHVVTKEN